MKSKTLIAMAVAGTFGLSAAAFAGSSHEVGTPSSPNESYPSASLNHELKSSSMSTTMGSSESLIEATGHELSLSDTSDWSASFDQMAEADTDVYLVGFAPMESWDYYVIDTGSSFDDGATYFLVPIDVSMLSDSAM